MLYNTNYFHATSKNCANFAEILIWINLHHYLKLKTGKIT